MHQRTSLTDEERVVLGRVKQRNDRLRRAARTPDEILRARRDRHPDGTKHCNGCGRDLGFVSFPAAAREPDGLGTRCTDCHPERRA